MAATVKAGYAARPHGLDGGVLVKLFLCGPAVPLPAGMRVTVGDRDLVVSGSAVRDPATLQVAFEGVEDREAAEEIGGETLWLSREDALSLGGSMPVGLFTGMTLVWQDGSGTVESFDPAPGNPLLQVRGPSGVFDVPVALLRAEGTIDWDAGRIEARLPLGLADGV